VVVVCVVDVDVGLSVVVVGVDVGLSVVVWMVEVVVEVVSVVEADVVVSGIVSLK
jgi:hypothetical protein